MYTADRQRALPYLEQVTGSLFEQWYLLHHRIVRVVTNHPALADQVRRFLYYAELMAEGTYDKPSNLPIAIPEDLLWQAVSHCFSRETPGNYDRLGLRRVRLNPGGMPAYPVG